MKLLAKQDWHKDGPKSVIENGLLNINRECHLGSLIYNFHEQVQLPNYIPQGHQDVALLRISIYSGIYYLHGFRIGDTSGVW